MATYNFGSVYKSLASKPQPQILKTNLVCHQIVINSHQNIIEPIHELLILRCLITGPAHETLVLRPELFLLVDLQDFFSDSGSGGRKKKKKKKALKMTS